MIQYEYTILAPEDVRECLDILNERGKQGFKVVGQYVDGVGQPIIILMREART